MNHFHMPSTEAFDKLVRDQRLEAPQARELHSLLLHLDQDLIEHRKRLDGRQPRRELVRRLRRVAIGENHRVSRPPNGRNGREAELDSRADRLQLTASHTSPRGVVPATLSPKQSHSGPPLGPDSTQSSHRCCEL
jgi:hypothetical protein